MATTAVKDAGSVLSVQIQAFQTQKASAASDVSFQNVLNGQTGKNSQTGETAGKTQKNDDGKQFKVNESSQMQKQDRVNKPAKTEEPEEIKPDENAMEVLMAASLQIVEQITEIFEISEEELQGIMDDMGLSQLSLLDSQTLGALLLKLGGAEDQTALLMDGDLYEKFNAIMAGLDEILSQDSGVADLDMGQLRDLMKAEDIPVQPKETEENPEEIFDPAKMQQAKEIAPEAADREKKPEVKITVQRSDGKGTEEMNADADNSLGVKELLEEAKTHQGEPGAGREGSSRGRGEHELKNAQNFAQGIQDVDQNFTNEAAVTETRGSFSPETQDIMRQIMDYMRVQVKPDMSSLEMQLHPASLGTLHVQIEAKGGVLTANFVTQNEAVRQALESQMVQLKESFAEQGVKVEAIEVTVQTHQFEENLEQNNREQNQPGNEARGSRRPRRINLNEMLSGEEPEMEEPDRIAAEMMAANGNTVDYTA